MPKQENRNMSMRIKQEYEDIICTECENRVNRRYDLHINCLNPPEGVVTYEGQLPEEFEERQELIEEVLKAKKQVEGREGDLPKIVVRLVWKKCGSLPVNFDPHTIVFCQNYTPKEPGGE